MTSCRLLECLRFFAYNTIAEFGAGWSIPGWGGTRRRRGDAVWRRRFDLAMLLLLLVALVATAASGLLADYLGIPRSLYHRLSAYSLAVLAFCHVILRRKQLWLRFRKVMQGRRQPVSRAAPAQSRPAGPAGRVILSRRGFLLSGLAMVAGFLLGRGLPRSRLPEELAGSDLGLAYHQWSKPGLWGMVQKPFHWGLPPPLYKEYTGVPRTTLPRNFIFHGLSFEETIQHRRSIRDYSGKPLTMSELSFLLYAVYGITEPSYPLRASPSAGALYPLEIYPVVHAVIGLASGVYHYRPRDHSLDLLRKGDFHQSLMAGTGGQDMVLQAAVVFVISALFQRTRWKYQERAYRYVLLDAGHLGENLYLAATSLGLGPCGMGAFFDEEINRLVGVDGNEEAVVYLVSVGRIPT